MLWHFAEPGTPEGLRGTLGSSRGDGSVDDGLLLFVQEGNELPLGSDVRFTLRSMYRGTAQSLPALREEVMEGHRIESS